MESLVADALEWPGSRACDGRAGWCGSKFDLDEREEACLVCCWSFSEHSETAGVRRL